MRRADVREAERRARWWWGIAEAYAAALEVRAGPERYRLWRAKQAAVRRAARWWTRAGR